MCAWLYYIPGNSNSRIRLPLLKSCSSSLASCSRAQYFWCSWSRLRCSSEQCVGQPQSGHSNLTALGCAWVCGWSWLCEEAHTGQGAKDRIASPLARTAGNGDFEKGWNKLSSVRRGRGSCGDFDFEERSKRLNMHLEVTEGRLMSRWGAADSRRKSMVDIDLSSQFVIVVCLLHVQTSLYFPQNKRNTDRGLYRPRLYPIFECPTENRDIYRNWVPWSCKLIPFSKKSLFWQLPRCILLLLSMLASAWQWLARVIYGLMIIILQICYIIFEPTVQGLTCQFHRIVQLPWALLSNRLLVRYVVLDDMELDLPLLMKLNIYFSHIIVLTSFLGTVSSCHWYLLSAILCVRSRPSEGKNRWPLNGDDPSYLLFVCNRLWGYITCWCFARGKRSPSVCKNCHRLTIILELEVYVVSAESAFKAVALAIREAIQRTGGNDVPSTKGVL